MAASDKECFILVLPFFQIFLEGVNGHISQIYGSRFIAFAKHGKFLVVEVKILNVRSIQFTDTAPCR